MAEIIGIVSGVIAFIGAAQKTIKASSDLISAKKERNDMLYHLSKVEEGLENLKNVMKETDAKEEDLKDIQEHLKEFEQMIKDLENRLKPPVTASRLRVPKRVSWALGGKSRAQEETAKIERFEKLVGQWLSSDTWKKTRKLDRRADDEECRKILNWVSPLNPFARQDQIFSARESGTGAWLLENGDFQKWKSGENEKPLWCFGIPGAGKTVLASIVMDHLCKESPENVGLAIVYCNYKEREVQTSVNLLSTILRQLYDRIPLSDKVKDLYQKHDKRNTRPTLSEISELLRAETDRFQKLFIILDAVDECTEENQCRQSLLDQLYALQPKARLMMTSRPEISIPTECTRLEIVASEADLERYIDGKLRLASRLRHFQDEWGRIKEAIIENADGMFLLAQIHMAALATATSKAKLLQILEDLTNNLDAAYTSTLERIESQPGLDGALAWRVLGWVSHALRPLSVRELQEALTIELGDTAIDEDALPNADILTSVCAGLVILDQSSNVIRLVHYTTQHYLERVRDTRFTNMQSEIAGICLTRLSFAGIENYDPPTFRNRYAPRKPSILDYAGQYGAVHARGAPEGHLKMMILNVLGQENIRRLIQLAINSRDYTQFGSSDETLSRMHLAVYFGLTETVSGMLLEGEDIESNGGYGTAITIASWRGFEQTIGLLLDKGADVNKQGGYYGNALYAASSKGHEQIVRILLDAGAEVNAQGGDYGNALQAASSKGHEQIVRILLDAGAEVNAQGEFYGNALQVASGEGHEQIVRIILDEGAEVNAQGGRYGNALQAASSKGYEQIVRILLDAGAEVNAQGGSYENALQAASSRGYEQIVRILLYEGAEVNAQGGQYGNALQAASRSGNDPVVRILLDAGAEVNAQGGEYGNALQAASSRGYEQIVRILLYEGAEVNAQGGQYGNALQAASRSGNDPVVRILLDAGAEVNAQGGEYGNALQAASEEGHEDIVRILLDAGAEVNAQGGEYGNALQAASYRGDEQIVRLLLDAGAEVNAQGGSYGNALQAASWAGHDQVVRILLDAGAEATEQDETASSDYSSVEYE